MFRFYIVITKTMNREEIEQVTSQLDKLICENKHFVEDVYVQKELRRQYVARLLQPLFIEVCMSRPLLFAKEIDVDCIEQALDEAV